MNTCTAHSHAFQTLTDAGKDRSPECLFCHTTGYVRPFGCLDQAATPGLADVQCEICHRATEQHGKVQSPITPVSPLTCIECHNPHTKSRIHIRRGNHVHHTLNRIVNTS
ncbi:MAG: multiheme c-type cytochrome [Gemmatimonadota bacterium]|nr:multiheme c-type cytochrome [Gemmatimonadota bacterium]